MSRSTFATQFYARESKVNKNGLARLELSIILNGKRIFVNLPYQVKPSDLKAKRQPKELVEYMDATRTRVNQILADMATYGEPITVDRIRDYLRTGGYKPYSVEDLFNEYLSVIKPRIGKDMGYYVYRKYELVKELFLAHTNPKKEASAINGYEINTFYNKLKGKYESATSAGYMTKLKTFIKYGMDTGHIQANPFATIKIVKEKKPIVYLKEDEIKILENADIPNIHLQQVLDCFIFELNSGISYADMKNITKEDVKEENGAFYIAKTRQKTGSKFTAVILPKGMEILRKYDYHLPIISNQKTNTALHIIEKLLGIKTPLHTHLARHSYLCTLLNKGVRMDVVSKAAGHSSIAITESFYAELKDKTIVNEIKQAFR